MYLLGIVVALLMAWLFKKTLLKGETPMLIMELPPYKRPVLRVVAAAHVGSFEIVFATGRHGDSGDQYSALVFGDVSESTRHWISNTKRRNAAVSRQMSEAGQKTRRTNNAGENSSAQFCGA